MVCSRLPSAPIRRCQKDTDGCWTPRLPETPVCKTWTGEANSVNTASAAAIGARGRVTWTDRKCVRYLEAIENPQLLAAGTVFPFHTAADL